MEISQPTLIINKEHCLRNINMMLTKAQNSKVRFRPHFKTHQSIEVGHWFRNVGVKAITVSSVEMAAYFATDEWDDITIAFPLNPAELDRINQISKNTKLNLIVDNTTAIQIASEKLISKTGIFVEVSTGYIRSGVDSRDIDYIEAIISCINKNNNLIFKGFLCHNGHSYEARTQEEISEIHKKSIIQLNHLKERYENQFPSLEISIGDTPCCSVISSFNEVDEIRPGNFIFYDLMQLQIGSCNSNQIAISMKCPIVSKNLNENEVVIHGGAIHFSKEYLTDKLGKKLFGILKMDEAIDANHPQNYLCRLSQEHGVLKVTDKIFQQLQIGDIVEIIPVHSCLTVHNMRHYFTENGDKIETINTTKWTLTN